MGPDVPLRAQIKTEWSDNKGEVGGPFRSIQRTFHNTHKGLSLMMNDVTKVKGRWLGHRVACQRGVKVGIMSVQVYW